MKMIHMPTETPSVEWDLGGEAPLVHPDAGSPEIKRRSTRTAIIGGAIAVTIALAGALGVAGYNAHETQQREEAVAAAAAAQAQAEAEARAAAEAARAKAQAEAQAEYDEFIDESEDVMGLLKEFSLRTSAGLTYSEHDELTDELVTKVARMTVDGTRAETIEGKISELVDLYGDANMAWNKKIYGPSYEESTREKELQQAWGEASLLWGEIQSDVDAWESSVENGNLPSAV